ncbi:aspartate kinase [Thermococcus gammatolerans]|uniref:Aspartate kinase (LysC) n=1 Tax=Thermococcus gammatolerans (strain DSM 15229 / JCM 11827 / EJ3) TaxID=593117 RepID=C5A1P0_THEGJ|nr:aspartate kinase [Thermococcus gammatolerans]ACS34309.1 Aspartate kinase (lysC) [Thermococcus gammatolerans EJ3]
MVEKLSVVKFGGSSVRDSFWSALELVDYLLEGSRLVVVVSALRGVTEKLLELSERPEWELFESIALEHSRIADKLGAEVKPLLDELEKAIKENRHDPEWKDYILSFGERFSAVLFAKALENEGIPTIPIDAREILTLRGSFGNAEIDFSASLPRVRKLGELAEKAVPVVTGFIGNLNGKTATLGRGGSDYTASALGAMLDAKGVLIMSDVKGIYTADPRLVPEARLIHFLSRERALLAAKLGMKALHPRTIEPLGSIPLILGRTEDWRLGTLVSDFGDDWPIIVHRVEGERARISIVGVEELPGWKGVKGNGYFSIAVEREELVPALREIHGVVFDEDPRSCHHSELWARV